MGLGDHNKIFNQALALAHAIEVTHIFTGSKTKWKREMSPKKYSHRNRVSFNLPIDSNLLKD